MFPLADLPLASQPRHLPPPRLEEFEKLDGDCCTHLQRSAACKQMDKQGPKL